MKALSEISHCAHCRRDHYELMFKRVTSVAKRMPNPYCKDASCACHQVRRNQEKKK